MADGSKSVNFVAGISFHLILALLVPGAMATFFFSWIFGDAQLLNITGDKGLTVLNAIAFSLVFGLILTPFAFFCERVRYRKDEKCPKKVSILIMKAEEKGTAGTITVQLTSS